MTALLIGHVGLANKLAVATINRALRFYGAFRAKDRYDFYPIEKVNVHNQALRFFVRLKKFIGIIVSAVPLVGPDGHDQSVPAEGVLSGLAEQAPEQWVCSEMGPATVGYED